MWPPHMQEYSLIVENLNHQRISAPIREYVGGTVAYASVHSSVCVDKNVQSTTRYLWGETKDSSSKEMMA